MLYLGLLLVDEYESSAIPPWVANVYIEICTCIDRRNEIILLLAGLLSDESSNQRSVAETVHVKLGFFFGGGGIYSPLLPEKL